MKLIINVRKYFMKNIVAFILIFVAFFNTIICKRIVYTPNNNELIATKGVIKNPRDAISGVDNIINKGFDKSDNPNVEGIAIIRKYFNEYFNII